MREKSPQHRFKRVAAQAALSISFLGSMQAGFLQPPVSAASCEQFLVAYSPSVSQELSDASDALSYTPPSLVQPEIFPNPSQARRDIGDVLPVVKKEMVVPEETIKKLQAAYYFLPPQETLAELEKMHANAATFASERKDIQQAAQQLQQDVVLCEQTVSSQMRRDSWYQQEQFDRAAEAFWNQYRLGILFLLAFLGVGALDVMFFSDGRK